MYNSWNQVKTFFLACVLNLAEQCLIFVPHQRGGERGGKSTGGHTVFGADPADISIGWHFLVCKISNKLVSGLEPNLHEYNIGGMMDLIRFSWPCPNFQGHSGAK